KRIESREELQPGDRQAHLTAAAPPDEHIDHSDYIVAEVHEVDGKPSVVRMRNGNTYTFDEWAWFREVASAEPERVAFRQLHSIAELLPGDLQGPRSADGPFEPGADGEYGFDDIVGDDIVGDQVTMASGAQYTFGMFTWWRIVPAESEAVEPEWPTEPWFEVPLTETRLGDVMSAETPSKNFISSSMTVVGEHEGFPIVQARQTSVPARVVTEESDDRFWRRHPVYRVDNATDPLRYSTSLFEVWTGVGYLRVAFDSAGVMVFGESLEVESARSLSRLLASVLGE
ncbi:MAG: hypothetical protein ACPGNP_12645, partial [Acidimicrobiales bacterium]